MEDKLEQQDSIQVELKPFKRETWWDKLKKILFFWRKKEK